MAHVSAHAPGIFLELQASTHIGPSSLIQGELDFVIAIDNPRILGLDAFPNVLCSMDLQSIRWTCVASADHPLIGEMLTKEQCLSFSHIYVRAPGDALPIQEAVERQLRVKLDVRVTTQGVLEVLFMLRGTSLIAILPEPLAALMAPDACLRRFELPEGLLSPRRLVRRAPQRPMRSMARMRPSARRSTF